MIGRSQFTSLLVMAAAIAVALLFTAPVLAAMLPAASIVQPEAPTSLPCPCSIWDTPVTPEQLNANEGAPQELGVRFYPDRNGYMLGLKFYKAISDTATSHWGHLWELTTDINGFITGHALVGVVNFHNETASGWQQAYFHTPVPVISGTHYIASYYASAGYFAQTINGDPMNIPVHNPPLHTTYQAGYRIAGPPDKFPGSGWTEYFGVDVVFSQTASSDTVAPLVVATTPSSAATNVGTGSTVEVQFNEALSVTTITSATFELRDPANNLITATVSADNFLHKARLTPISALKFSTTYTARAKSGASGIKDLAGNPLASDYTWSFTTAAAPAALSNEGPGGPILVVARAGYPFSRYYAEVLRAEGFNAFTLTDVSNVTASVLDSYDVVILGEMPLTGAQVTLFSDWVTAGGNLIAMRPDKQLASLLGLTDANNFLSDAYLKIDTSAAPGAGIVSATIQYHGAADRYTLNGAAAVATLYATSAQATSNPAVTLRSVGTNGGQAAAFTFDLARSIVYLRQGNPLWAGEDRDGDGVTRANDMFFGSAWIDPQPDWLDTTKIGIPQADEQQRLLANLILHMNADKKPLPRFWYLPRGEKAVVVMTGDDHGYGYTKVRFQEQMDRSPVGCSVEDWQCLRSTSYFYPNATMVATFPNSLAYSYTVNGFELSYHIDTLCSDYTTASLNQKFLDQRAEFTANYPSLTTFLTNRTHCIVWNDWATQAKVALSNGVRLDTNYYSLYTALFEPNNWDYTQPGYLTGSGVPMRFVDADGTPIDVYQVMTHLPDDGADPRADINEELWLRAFLDRAQQSDGYYGMFALNIHTDFATPNDVGSNIITLTQEYGVPMISSLQLLDWLDGRNTSSFQSVVWTTNTFTSTLAFTVVTGTHTSGIQAVVPTRNDGSTLVDVARNGSSISYAIETIKGIEYALFDSRAGAYVATYQKLQPVTYVAPSGLCGGAQPCFDRMQNALIATDASGTVVISGVNTITAPLSTGSDGIRSVVLRSVAGARRGTLLWTGATGPVFNLAAGDVSLYGLNVTTTVANATVFTMTTTGRPYGYANNIVGFKRACSDIIGGCLGLGHNWWGVFTYTLPPSGLADASWNTRLGAPVITWTVGSNGAALADGIYGTARITATTGSGQVVMISHGSVQPFFDSNRTAICSSYFDIFLASGGSGSVWDILLPVKAACLSGSVSAQASHISPVTLAGSSCDTRIDVSSPYHCWRIWTWTGTVSKAGSNYLVHDVAASWLSGSPFVAGEVSGDAPTAIRMLSFSAQAVERDWPLFMGGLFALGVGGIVVVSVTKRRRLRR